MFEKTAIISQARMNSSRLPGKVLKEIHGRTILEYHVNRLKWAGLPVVVATSRSAMDDAIVKICRNLKVICFRGSEENVLERYYLTARKYHFETIIRVCADSPLIDGALIRKALVDFNNCDYLSNTLIRTYPLGFNFEIFAFSALEKAYHGATLPMEKEHVTPFIYHTHRELFRIRQFLNRTDHSHLRLTLDTEDDFEVIKELISVYGCEHFHVDQIIAVMEEHPYLHEMNKHVHQRELGE